MARDTQTEGRELATRMLFSPRWLSLPKELRFEEWAAYLGNLARASRYLMWLIGDALAYGRERWGEEAYRRAIAAIGDLGYAPKTLDVAQWLSTRIPPEERNLALSWYHHQKVAVLQPRERKRWLEAAVAEKMTARQLGAAIRQAKLGSKVVSLRMEKRITPEIDRAMTAVQVVDREFWAAWANAANERTASRRTLDARALLRAAENYRDKLDDLVVALGGASNAAVGS